MTVTRTRVRDGADAWGRHRVDHYDYNFSGTYAAYTINATDVGMKVFDAVKVVGSDASLGTYLLVAQFPSSYASSPGIAPQSVTIHLYSALGTEASGNLSPAVNFRLEFVGQ